MIQRKMNPYSQDEPEDKKYIELDKQNMCDKCKKGITSTRVLVASGGRWIGVYCSHRCYLEACDDR